jgi:hypothetical protein
MQIEANRELAIKTSIRIRMISAAAHQITVFWNGAIFSKASKLFSFPFAKRKVTAWVVSGCKCWFAVTT